MSEEEKAAEAAARWVVSERTMALVAGGLLLLGVPTFASLPKSLQLIKMTTPQQANGFDCGGCSCVSGCAVQEPPTEGGAPWTCDTAAAAGFARALPDARACRRRVASGRVVQAQLARTAVAPDDPAAICLLAQVVAVASDT